MLLNFWDCAKLHFLVTGHTKNKADLSFDYMKQKTVINAAEMLEFVEHGTIRDSESFLCIPCRQDDVNALKDLLELIQDIG